MRVFTVHHELISTEPDRGVILVKEGFCWPAFFFSFIWALVHRLWLVAALIVAANVVLELAFGLLGADEIVRTACGLGVSIFVGASANDWRRGKLARSGYREAGIVAAVDGDAAYRRFFDLNPDLPSGRAAAPLV